MPPVQVQIQPLTNTAKLPTYATAGSVGADIYADDNYIIHPQQWMAVSTGIAMAVPQGYEVQIRPRSGLAAKFGVTVLNAPGTIDSDYRGEVKVLLINHGNQQFEIKKGDRIAQMVVASVEPTTLVESLELDDTERGAGGFGSTGTT